jgi:hypothetical protein
MIYITQCGNDSIFDIALVLTVISQGWSKISNVNNNTNYIILEWLRYFIISMRRTRSIGYLWHNHLKISLWVYWNERINAIKYIRSLALGNWGPCWNEDLKGIPLASKPSESQSNRTIWCNSERELLSVAIAYIEGKLALNCMLIDSIGVSKNSSLIRRTWLNPSYVKLHKVESKWTKTLTYRAGFWSPIYLNQMLQCESDLKASASSGQKWRLYKYSIYSQIYSHIGHFFQLADKLGHGGLMIKVTMRHL